VSLPLGAESVDFIFSEPTQDFQIVTVQGQLSYRIADAHKLISMFNFTINQKGAYLGNDPEKLSQNILNMVRVTTRKELSAFTLKPALLASDIISGAVKEEALVSKLLNSIGLELINISILAIKPSKETERALEADTREALLRQADDAIYLRRNAAIEHERRIKENELNTEAAVETKKREIMERRMEAQLSEQAKRQEIEEAKMAGQMILEQENAKFVSVKTENERKLSEAKAYTLDAILRPLRESDPKLVEALASKDMDPAKLIALSFKRLSEQAEKIGQLNISHDLLTELLNRTSEDGRGRR
jgi:hypothetical protein